MTDDHADHTSGPPGRHHDDVLACGRLTGDLLDQVADGRGHDRDAHQTGCVHCRAALAEYDRLWTPLHDLASERVSAPDGPVEQALARIRGAVTGTDYATLTTADGVTRVAARVVVVAARTTAQDVPGVRVAIGRHLADHGRTGPAVTAGVAGASTAVEIIIAADYGLPLHELAARVRRAVATRIRTLTDLEPVDVTVVVDDVLL